MIDDFTLLTKVKTTGDSEAMSQLICQHSGVFLNVLDRYLPTEKFPTQKEDLRAEKNFHIYQAVMSFDLSKNMKFSTYLGQTIKWKCLSLKSRGPDKDTVFIDSLESPLAEKEEEDNSDKFKIEEIFQYAEKYPNDLARKIIELRYNSGTKTCWEAIAKQLDISVSWAIMIHSQFIKDAQQHFCN